MNQASQEQREKLQAEQESKVNSIPDQDLDNHDGHVDKSEEIPTKSTESTESLTGNTSSPSEEQPSLDLKNVTSKEVQKMIQDSLEQEDPWMKRKTEENQTESERVLDLDN